MIRSSSNGGMIASPRSAAISSARAWRSSERGPTTTISAAVPGDAVALDRRRVVRHHDDRGRPSRRARARDACAWLPDEYVMTPARSVRLGERGDGIEGATDLESRRWAAGSRP
jgi:hypothetical protein